MRQRWQQLPQWSKIMIGMGSGALGLIGIAALAYSGVALYSRMSSNSVTPIRSWFDNPVPEVREPLITNRLPSCEDAPFILPSDGFIGLLWRDSVGPYDVFNRHTGIDVFGDGEPGDVPVYAVYDGYLTRLDNWLSTVIIRHEDPLQEGRTIWTYYTHMASANGETSFVSEAFPPGTSEVFVEQGALLGYQGDYSGAAFAVGLHVHLSIVLSEDDGSFKNEAQLGNTLDPSPYFGLSLNIDDLPDRPITCG